MQHRTVATDHDHQLADIAEIVDWHQLPRRQIERAAAHFFHHDLMAEVRTYAEQCPTGGGIIHLGATSAFVTDNAELMQQRDALLVVRRRVVAVIERLTSKKVPGGAARAIGPSWIISACATPS